MNFSIFLYGAITLTKHAVVSFMKFFFLNVTAPTVLLAQTDADLLKKK